MREKKFVVDYCDWDNDEELWTVTDKNLEELQKRFEQLQHQLKVSEKALELACERVKYFEEMQDREMGFSEFFGYESDYDLKAIIEQYKEQAKEMMKSE